MSRPILAVCLLVSAAGAAQPVPVTELRSTGGLPAPVVGRFREPAVFQQASDGVYFVFDRRAQTVSRIDADGGVTTVVEIGPERGRILGASAFDLGPNGRFVVADAPEGRERVQLFDLDGTRLGGFTLPGRAAPRITIGELVLNGIGSLDFTGRSILMSQPELGGLATQFSLNGQPFHTFGVFRRTGHEGDRDVHLALNTGLPLANPRGGFYFVFQAGRPVFRKYDERGALVFERHIESRELDPVLAAQPTRWPRREDDSGQRIPVVPPTVRTAAVDPDGNLWVALTIGSVYVYDGNGERIRTLRLRGAGPVFPTSLFFASPSRLLVTPGAYEFTIP